MMNERGKSDTAIVAVKPANKAEQSAAELVEQRAETWKCEPAKRVPDAEPGERVTGAGAPLQRPDCVAGHVALELRNVGKNYPFERSRRFPGIQPNSSHRDHSRLSCVAGDTQLGPGSCAEFKRRAAITAKAVERLALSPARA